MLGTNRANNRHRTEKNQSKGERLRKPVTRVVTSLGLSAGRGSYNLKDRKTNVIMVERDYGDIDGLVIRSLDEIF